MLYKFKDKSYTSIDGNVTVFKGDWGALLGTPFYIDNISGESNTITITRQTGSINAPVIEPYYSLDKVEWISMATTSGTVSITIPAGERIYIRCDASSWGIWKNYNEKGNTITSTGAINVGGNIMSLLYGDRFTGFETEFPSPDLNGQFCKLFYQNTNLLDASKLLLPATTLADYCYGYMFFGCTGLTKSPKTLPATTLADYCYCSMFDGCTALVDVPKTLPATTLADSCYTNMFQGCTSLTKAPDLPATTLTPYCYYWMFNNCTALQYIKCLAGDIRVNNCTTAWVNNVPVGGIFYRKAGTDWSTGSSNSGIPRGWTVADV